MLRWVFWAFWVALLYRSKMFICWSGIDHPASPRPSVLVLITTKATSAMLELRVFEVAAGAIGGWRDRHSHSNGRLKPKIDERLGGDDCLLAMGSGIDSRSGSAARQASDSGPFAAPGKRADDGADCRTAAGLGGPICAPRRAFLAERVGH